MQPLPAFLARIAVPQTPVLVIRRAALEANLAYLQSACSAAGVRLRAHGKMHKCTTLGRRQVALGAVGLCCQTVGEAQAYAAGGIGDLLVTAPVPPWGWAKLAALARERQISAVVDSEAQLAAASMAAMAAGVTLGIHVDIDPGMARAGVAPAAAAALVRRIGNHAGLRYEGIQAYCGHHQHMPTAARRAAHADWTETLRQLLADLRSSGLAPGQVTGGGTGTYALDLAAGLYTEIQAGSYALMDVEYGDCGGPEGDWPFQPALFCAATIVSARHATHATCDAGLKAFHMGGPPPRVVAPAAATWRSMGDEHGAIIPAAGAAPPAESSMVWLQPGHVDPTVALHDA